MQAAAQRGLGCRLSTPRLHASSCACRRFSVRGGRKARPQALPGTEIRPRMDAMALLVSTALVLQATLPVAVAAAPPSTEVDAATLPFVQEMLRKTEEKREERREERLKAYFKRNFKEYFEYEASDKDLARRRGISADTQAAIARWLQENNQ